MTYKSRIFSSYSPYAYNLKIKLMMTLI